MAHPHDSLLVTTGYWLLRKLFGPIVRALWVREVRGLEKIPGDGPLIFAFNHQSYFDFICFIAVCPRPVHYLSAEKFFSSAFWAPLMRITGQIRVERGVRDKRSLHDLVRDHLNTGKAIGIFPEGTRSPDREKMLRAFSGVAKYAFHKDVPVVPVGIRGTYEVMSRFDKRPRFVKSVEIHVGDPIVFTDYHRAKMNRKAFGVLTHKIMMTISSLSGKEYPYTPHLS